MTKAEIHLRAEQLKADISRFNDITVDHELNCAIKSALLGISEFCKVAEAQSLAEQAELLTEYRGVTL